MICILLLGGCGDEGSVKDTNTVNDDQGIIQADDQQVEVGSEPDQDGIKSEPAKESEYYQLNIPEVEMDIYFANTLGTTLYENMIIKGNDRLDGDYTVFIADTFNKNIYTLVNDNTGFVKKQFINEYGTDLNIKAKYEYSSTGDLLGFENEWITYIDEAGRVKIVDLRSGDRNVLFEGPVNRHFYESFTQLHVFIAETGIFVGQDGGTQVAKIYDGKAKNLLYDDNKLVFIDKNNNLNAIYRDGSVAEPPFNLEGIQSYVDIRTVALYMDLNNNLYVSSKENWDPVLVKESVDWYYTVDDTVFISKDGEPFTFIGGEFEESNKVALSEDNYGIDGRYSGAGNLILAFTDRMKVFTDIMPTKTEFSGLSEGNYLGINIKDEVLMRRITNTVTSTDNSGDVDVSTIHTDDTNDTDVQNVESQDAVDNTNDASSSMNDVSTSANNSEKVEITEYVKQGITPLLWYGQPTEIQINHGGTMRPGMDYFIDKYYENHGNIDFKSKNSRVATIGEMVYFINQDDSLVRIDANAPSKQRVLGNKVSKPFMAYSDSLYYLNNNVLIKHIIDDVSMRLAEGVLDFDLDDDSGDIAFVESESNSIFVLQTQTGERKLISEGDYREINYDNGIIYALSNYNENEDQIFIYNMSNGETQWQPIDKSSMLTVDQNRMYYIDSHNALMSKYTPSAVSNGVPEYTSQIKENVKAVSINNGVIYIAFESDNGQFIHQVSKYLSEEEGAAIYEGPTIEGIDTLDVYYTSNLVIYEDQKGAIKVIDLKSGKVY